MKLFSKLKLPKKRLILYLSIGIIVVIGLGLFIWGVKTGRIKLRAEEVCPASSICNVATVTWDGGSATSNMTVTTLITKPNAPTNLAASATSASVIHLTWTDNSSNETGFKIERSLTSGGPYSPAGTANPNETTYDDQGLSASTTYYYIVKSTNEAGDSSPSNQASATTPPGGQATTININLTLAGKTNATSNGTTLRIFSVGGASPIYENTNVSTDSSGNSQITAPGLSVGTAYDFWLKVPYFLAQKNSNIVLTNPLSLNFGAQRAGDLDNNNQISMSDYQIIISTWRKRSTDSGFNPIADIQYDSQINMSDIQLLITNWRVRGPQ